MYDILQIAQDHIKQLLFYRYLINLIFLLIILLLKNHFIKNICNFIAKTHQNVLVQIVMF